MAVAGFARAVDDYRASIWFPPTAAPVARPRSFSCFPPWPEYFAPGGHIPPKMRAIKVCHWRGVDHHTKSTPRNTRVAGISPTRTTSGRCADPAGLVCSMRRSRSCPRRIIFEHEGNVEQQVFVEVVEVAAQQAQ